MPLIRSPVANNPVAAKTLPVGNLSSGSAEERWAAVRGCPLTFEGIEALSVALSSETEPRIREAMFTRLALAATQQSVSAVLPLLRSDDASLRTGALDALRLMPLVVEVHLDDLLADQDSDIRLLACEIVREIPAERAIPRLCSLLEDEGHPNVCAAAVDVLAEIGNSTALPTLNKLAERFDKDKFLIFAIRIAVERIGNQNPLPSHGCD